MKEYFSISVFNTTKQLSNFISMLCPTREQRQLFMLRPEQMPHGSGAEKRGQSSDNCRRIS
jgi:hypothetical protein